MIKQLIAICVAITLMGCSTHFESVNQVNDSAFLQLEGQFLPTQLIIDNNPAIDLTEENVETFLLNGKTVARFPISIGKHTIKILRNNKVVVNRNIYLSNDNTFEVVVP